MDTIQLLALAERDQHTERARMLGQLASDSIKPAVSADCDELDLELIPHFIASDYA